MVAATRMVAATLRLTLHQVSPVKAVCFDVRCALFAEVRQAQTPIPQRQGIVIAKQKDTHTQGRPDLHLYDIANAICSA